jgi:periplasmic divalent cation tolerance protein
MIRDIFLLISNFPGADTARKAVRLLVEERLIACGNLITGVESIYEWKGVIENTHEVTVIAKTTAERADEAMTRLRALHPYEVPEILLVPVTTGWPDYLSWIAAQCAPHAQPDRP